MPLKDKLFLVFFILRKFAFIISLEVPIKGVENKHVAIKLLYE